MIEQGKSDLPLEKMSGHTLAPVGSGEFSTDNNEHGKDQNIGDCSLNVAAATDLKAIATIKLLLTNPLIDMKTCIHALFLFSLFLGVSCSKDSQDIHPINFVRTDVVNSKYLFDKEEHDFIPVVGGTAEFQYSNSKIVKRMGASMFILTPGGVYRNGIYDTVEYTAPNVITVVSMDNLDFLDIYPVKRVITLNHGLIDRKIAYPYRGNGVDTMYVNNDTIYYSYSKNGFIPGNIHRLIKTVQYIRSDIVTRDYSYDGKGNLQNIFTVTKSRYGNFVDTAKETFGGYDDKPNPLRGVCLWEDLLYRTLSTNNFTTYTYENGSNTESRRWTLVYDSKGNVDYSK